MMDKLLDLGLFLPREGLEYCTTLALTSLGWKILELCERISGINELDGWLPGVAGIFDVISVGIREIVAPKTMGLITEDVAPSRASPATDREDDLPFVPEAGGEDAVVCGKRGKQ